MRLPSRRFSLWVALLIAASCAPDARAGYEDALEKYLNQDYPKALESFEKFTGRSPSDPRRAQALYYAAICRLKLDQVEPAIRNLRELLNSRGSEPPGSFGNSAIRFALGAAYRQAGDETSAAAFFETAWLSASNPADRAAARDQIRAAPAKTPTPPALVAISPPPAPRRPTAEGDWVVQIVSTRDPAQAGEFLDRIQNAGWPVYRERAEVSDTSYIRVRVGPFASESEAYRVRSRLRAHLGVSGWVTRK